MDDERRLLIRGFPHWLKGSEKESLLQHFGAKEVVNMPSRGKMRNCVFATFSCHEDAKRTLSRLHQLKILNSRLVIEYVQEKHTQLLQDIVHDNENEEEDGTEHIPLSPKHTHPPKPQLPSAPRLSYHYPPPTHSTITNITHTLLTIPKFYVQVLHLMNLMNLPPPFGPPTPAPPDMIGPGRLGEPGEEREEGDLESEIGSDSEVKGNSERSVRLHRKVKTRQPHIVPSKGLSLPAKRRHSNSQQQFDQVSPLQVIKKISLNVPDKIDPRPLDQTNIVSITTINASLTNIRPLQPVAATTETSDEATQLEDDEEEEMFITAGELAQNRLTHEEMQEMRVFRGYNPGEPSLRLYIKNLSKHTTEQDLRYIYGRYIDWSDERQRNVFDVRLMQSGRMKGQAFIGLPSEEVAAIALRETNGYQLEGAPIIVHFARTAKAKPEQSSY